MAVIGTWSPLGLGKNVFYSKYSIYSMNWEDQIDFSKVVVAAASYGGPIAATRDDTKIIKVRGTTKKTIYVFTSAGQVISQFVWMSGKLLQMHWTAAEDLLCVQEDGQVLVYDIFGHFSRNFGMGQEAKDTGVIESKVFSTSLGTGLAILTGQYRIFMINNVNNPTIRRLAEVPGLNSPPSSWAVFNLDRQTKALVAKDADLYLLDQNGHCQQQFPEFVKTFKAITEMSISLNCKHLALFTDTGALWMGSSDLKSRYCEFDTKCEVRPKQLVWCGKRAVVAHWDKFILLVGFERDFIHYSYDVPLHLIPELDCLRIISQESQEILQEVPKSVVSVFKAGSMEPGAILLGAFDEFRKQSHKADEYVRMIKDQLEEGVNQCIEAAGHMFDTTTSKEHQKKLLRAASFGKCFAAEMNSEGFVSMCQMLRVLNAVRDEPIGMPLTYLQLEQLTLRVLIDRLVLRRQYPLAIRICEYLKIPDTEGASRILAHWACYKVQQTSIDDETVAQAITDKLGQTPGISYSEIASKASDCGRTQLAIRLLDHEPRASEQVPLLMKIKRDDLALTKAIDSGDTDLVYTVILQLKNTMKWSDFLLTVTRIPVAYNLYIQLCRQQNRELLRDMYYQCDDFMQEGYCFLTESYEQQEVVKRLSLLQRSHDAFSKAKNELMTKQSEEEMKILRLQGELEKRVGRPFLGLSVHDTVRALIKAKENKLVEEVRKDFKIPDRRFWWLRINALAESGDWEELDKFSRSKKSPIGYEPFVEVCANYGRTYDAKTKYIPRVSAENKVRCFIKLGLLDDAAEFAFQQKSLSDLNFVQSKCGPGKRALVEKILDMKSQLSSKR